MPTRHGRGERAIELAVLSALGLLAVASAVNAVCGLVALLIGGAR